MNEDKILKILNTLVLDVHGFKKDTKERFDSIDNRLEEIDEKLDELKSSSNVLDEILVEHPIERIVRLEKHSKLPPFIPAVSVE